ncbi:MAG: CapA family protein, partial [Anaerolineales bacterium]|nr:CapA family protein [Anaerolineales bacterium]
MSIRTSIFLPYLGVLLSGWWVASCSILQPAKTPALQPPPKAVSPTPTVFLPPTEISGGDIWLSPSLPPTFAESWQHFKLQSRGFDLTSERERASIEITLAGEESLTTWIYALVAPFPTTSDGLSWDTLQALWSGPEGLETMLVSGESRATLESLLGPPGENVHIAPAESLIDLAWQARPAYALIPFEALEPRWKVLELDGQSPIRREFDIATYPLKVVIGLDGPPGAAEILSSLLELPASNRDPGQMTVLVMTGVTALTRATAWQMERRGVDFPGQKIGDWLRGADLAHISNEVAFALDCPPPDPVQEGLKFCSDPDYIELLELVGVDIIELTGNHVRDYGSAALEDTLEAYRARGWGTFGGGFNLEAANEPLLLEHN